LDESELIREMQGHMATLQWRHTVAWRDHAKEPIVPSSHVAVRSYKRRPGCVEYRLFVQFYFVRFTWLYKF